MYGFVPERPIFRGFIISNDRKGLIVNKSELIEAIAQEADISKAAAVRIIFQQMCFDTFFLQNSFQLLSRYFQPISS